MRTKLAVSTLVLAVAAFCGCSSGGGNTTDAGSGGAPGSGGSVGSGGTPGTGGRSGSGGATGSGGAIGSGGAVGTDGGSGGVVGTDGGSGGATDAGIDSPTSCPAVASNWVGEYDMTRLVIRYPPGCCGDLGGRAITHTRAGARDGNGVVWTLANDASVSLKANGDVSAHYFITKDGLGFMNNSAQGTWIKEGASTLAADWQGDSYYRRRFAVTVQGCVMRLVKTFPEDFTAGSNMYEHIEADLQRR